MASSKWLGFIKVIAQVVLGQQFFCIFWMHTVVSSSPEEGGHDVMS